MHREYLSLCFHKFLCMVIAMYTRYHFTMVTLYCNNDGVIFFHKVMRILLFPLIEDKHEQKLLMHSVVQCCNVSEPFLSIDITHHYYINIVNTRHRLLINYKIQIWIKPNMCCKVILKNEIAILVILVKSIHLFS